MRKLMKMWPRICEVLGTGSCMKTCWKKLKGKDLKSLAEVKVQQSPEQK